MSPEDAHMHINVFHCCGSSGRDSSDDGEWTGHRREAWPAASHPRAAGGTPKGEPTYYMYMTKYRCICNVFPLVSLPAVALFSRVSFSFMLNDFSFRQRSMRWSRALRVP